jgi:hypothetical protein
VNKVFAMSSHCAKAFCIFPVSTCSLTVELKLTRCDLVANAYSLRRQGKDANRFNRWYRPESTPPRARRFAYSSSIFHRPFSLAITQHLQPQSPGLEARHCFVSRCDTPEEPYTIYLTVSRH